MPFIQSEVVKCFIDRFKATCPYKRNNTNNYNKITNTTLSQYKKINMTAIEQFGMPNTHIYSEAGRFYDCSSLAAELYLLWCSNPGISWYQACSNFCIPATWRSILMCNKSTSAGTSLEGTPMVAHATLHRTFNPLGSKCPWWQDVEVAS